MNQRITGLVAASSLIVLGSTVLPGCDERSAADSARSFDVSGMPPKAERLALVKDYANGIFVFPVAFFPQTLSDFRAEHPELRLVAISQGNDVRYGYGNSAVVYAENFVVAFEKVDDAGGQQTRPVERR